MESGLVGTRKPGQAVGHWGNCISEMMRFVIYRHEIQDKILCSLSLSW